ncbi:MAG: hypothetical protein WCS80_01180 [Bacilli bacterium]
MRVIMESAFDVIYLLSVITIGIYMIVKARKNKDRELLLYGIMAVSLGGGDAFHLIPRIIGLIQFGDIDMYTKFAFPLGLGKLITSITMTVFYLLLYYVWKVHYGVKGMKSLTISMYALAVIRVILCCFPQNEWFVYPSPLSWSIYRNIPFAILGIIIIILFAMKSYPLKDKVYMGMPIAIFLSFAFYFAVVIWGESYPTVGLLMIPKTLAYVAVVIMGLVNMNKKEKKHEQA